jgi:DNA-binding NarL/FixJ family response regulator
VSNNIKIILVDDHRLFLDSLKFVLECAGSIEIIGEARNGKEFLNIIEDKKPDIVLMDISMPGMDGIEATKLALEKFPDLKIIALSMFSNNLYYQKMIEAGVKGFVLKESGSDELIEAIETISNGQYYFSKEIVNNMILSISGKDKVVENTQQLQDLSERETEVLKFICDGLSSTDIATKLSISQRTVEGHRSNILNKTASKNSIHLVLYALKNKLIEV